MCGALVQTRPPRGAASPACKRRAHRRCLRRDARRPPQCAEAIGAGCTLTTARGKRPCDRGRTCWPSGIAGAPARRRKTPDFAASPRSTGVCLLRGAPQRTRTRGLCARQSSASAISALCLVRSARLPSGTRPGARRAHACSLLCRSRQRQVKSVPSPSPAPPSPQRRSPPVLGDSHALPPHPSGTLRAARVIDEPGGPIDRGPPTPTLNSCRRASRAPTPGRAAHAASCASRTHIRAALGANVERARPHGDEAAVRLRRAISPAARFSRRTLPRPAPRHSTSSSPLGGACGAR